jgi:hypothetical protein
MNSNDEYVNQITLRYLTSVDYQHDVQGDHDKHNEGNKINKSKQKGSKIYRQKDKKFYKKRISNIIKLLLNDGGDGGGDGGDGGGDNDNNINQPNCPLFPDIKNTFDIFVLGVFVIRNVSIFFCPPQRAFNERNVSKTA